MPYRRVVAPAVVAAVVGLAVGGGGAAPVRAAGAAGFAAPVFVDRALGGGEPFVAYSPVSHLLVYSSHEGTTHIFAGNVPGAPAESGAFILNYRNQVNIWTSADGGATWQVVNYIAGFFTDPTKNTGFSDPDLTQDEAGNIYDTGIDLANDALFSSQDGGRSFPTGTINCHEGDRPWLAGGRANEVFLSTDSDAPAGHYIFRSTDAGASCGQTGIQDTGGVGKLFYDHARGQLVEPVVDQKGVGIGILPNASSAYGATLGTFSHVSIATTSVFAHWPSMAIDAAGTYYMVWDTDDRAAGTSGGCLGTPTPLANSIEMSTSSDGGHHWNAPVTIAHQAGHRLLWPWVTAGSGGRAEVVWYQYDRVTDPDCGSGDVSIGAAQVAGATTPATTTLSVVNASGRTVHSGTICTGGTTCAVLGSANGEDRRLGDFLTVGTDARGCALIASGDTTLTDAVTGGPSPVSHPIVIRQNSGLSLTGLDCAAAVTGAPVTPPPVAAGGGSGASLANTGGVATGGAAAVLAAVVVAGGTVASRRRRPR